MSHLQRRRQEKYRSISAAAKAMPKIAAERHFRVGVARRVACIFCWRRQQQRAQLARSSGGNALLSLLRMALGSWLFEMTNGKSRRKRGGGVFRRNTIMQLR